MTEVGAAWLDEVTAPPLDTTLAAARDGMSYLASPIAGPNKKRMLEMATQVVLWFKNQGCPVYSPAAYINYGKAPPQGWYQWDIQFVRAAKRLIILDIPPYTGRSKGCRYELDEARKLSIPTYRLPWRMLEGRL